MVLEHEGICCGLFHGFDRSKWTPDKQEEATQTVREPAALLSERGRGAAPAGLLSVASGRSKPADRLGHGFVRDAEPDGDHPVGKAKLAKLKGSRCDSLVDRQL